MKTKVFLGGTCDGYDWRTELIEILDLSIVEPFNPVVKEWNDEARKREIYEREHSDYCLYVITPDMKGCYSIAEVIDDSNKRPEKTIFLVINKILRQKEQSVVTFLPKMEHSLEAVKSMVKRNGGLVFESLEELAMFLNLKVV